MFDLYRFTFVTNSLLAGRTLYICLFSRRCLLRTTTIRTRKSSRDCIRSHREQSGNSNARTIPHPFHNRLLSKNRFTINYMHTNSSTYFC